MYLHIHRCAFFLSWACLFLYNTSQLRFFSNSPNFLDWRWHFHLTLCCHYSYQCMHSHFKMCIGISIIRFNSEMHILGSNILKGKYSHLIVFNWFKNTFITLYKQLKIYVVLTHIQNHARNIFRGRILALSVNEIKYKVWKVSEKVCSRHRTLRWNVENLPIMMENKIRVPTIPTSQHCRAGPIHFIETWEIKGFNYIIVI